MKWHLNRWKFIVHRWHQEVLQWAFLDKHGFTLVQLDYKQTLCTLLCLLLCMVFEWAVWYAMRPWETPDMKGVVCTPRKFFWHLITKREEWKRISQSPGRSPRVILRERNLCDIDRIVHKRRRFGCARTNTHSLTNFLSLAFFGVLPGSEAAEVMDVRLPSFAVLLDSP